VFHLKSYAGNITVEILLHMSLETAKEAWCWTTFSDLLCIPPMFQHFKNPTLWTKCSILQVHHDSRLAP
jgi:hypothetical protein